MRRKSAPGYTLLEVLVVVAIIAVLFGVGIASYSRFDRVRKVEQSALGFGMYLRETQKMADSGQKPSAGCSGSLTGFQVYTSATPTTQTFVQRFTLCPTTAETTEYDLINDAIFTQPFDVIFKTVGQGVTVTNGETIITSIAPSTSYKVNVESGGAITVERIP
jgi:prepilin-type N-terminal cleavage/methylation domain-containing protein